MRILLTGATGTIGKEIGKKLVAEGHSLVVVSRNPMAAPKQLPFPAEIHFWDPTKLIVSEDALKNIEAIICLAGEPIAEGRWTEKKKKQIRESRILGVRTLLEGLILETKRNAPVLKTIILGSAIGYYGNQEKGSPLTESGKKGTGFLADLVQDWEQEIDRLTEMPQLAKVRIAKIRTGVVLSRQGGALSKMLPAFQLGLGGKLGSGLQWMSWIHLEDITSLFSYVLKNDLLAGVINGVAPQPITNADFTLELNKVLGHRTFLPVPASLLKIGLGEMSQILLEGQSVIPQKAMESGFKFQFPTISEALKDLALPLFENQFEYLAEQWVPKSPSEIFTFFCDEKNLEELTPSFLGFKVLRKSTQKIQQGTLIDYRLKIHGIPTRWQTRIDAWNPHHSFVDVQLKGPYRKWHHTHEFIALAGGTLLRDRVFYKLPLGILGQGLASKIVLSDVNKIFSYRRDQIFRRFFKDKNMENVVR